MKKPVLQYAILTALFAWAFIAQATYSGLVVYAQINSSHLISLPFFTSDYSTVIDRVPSTYSNTGLRIGDDVAALDRRPVEGRKQLDELQFSANPGETLIVTVHRQAGKRTETLEIPVRLQTSQREWTTTIVLFLFLPLSCLLVGFYIAFARPRDPLAWITMLMLASVGQMVSGVSWAVWSPWRELLLAYHPLLANSWPLWMVLFALYFPISFPWWRRHSWLNWILAVPSIVFAALDLYGNFRAGIHIHDLAWLATFERAAYKPVSLLFTAYVFAFFALLGWKRSSYRSVEARRVSEGKDLRSPQAFAARLDQQLDRLQNELDADARRRLNVMLVGCSLALLPLLPVISGEVGFTPPLPPWLTTVCVLMLGFFPITMAYVIVVQRAMDVRMVVRSGVRYAFANTGIKVLRTLLITAVVLLTIHFEQQSGGRLEGILIAAIGVGLIVTVGRVARKTSKWMDRRFFREAYNAELILTELSNSVAGMRNKKAVIETVARRIADSLHVMRVAFLLERGDSFNPAYALGFGVPPSDVQIKTQSATVRLLRQLQGPSRIYFDDPQSWVHGAPESERRVLNRLDTQILIPVTLRDRLLGIISLGAKKSDAPYSKGDLQLLSGVASQTGLALENAELTESIRQEVAERERLDRELEIAREVQQRLFPQKLPQVDGLDFAGYCRPAQGVGGDYYDFIRLPDDCLGIAIGDVSGKGIAAALMMASLQASLRGQTIKPCATLSEMIQHINWLVYDASADNRYATFFYAQYDPRTRVLRYVNAGHNPPMVCRRSNEPQKILRLEDGGTVVGLFPDYPYTEARVQLESGDILVAFTDGISEAMNRDEEEFDEERLIRAVRIAQARSAADMITDILQSVDGFTAGARQHDDMTLVVVRVR